MTIIATDWVVDSSTKNIRYIGDNHNGASPSYVTVIDFHRWLQDLADDAAFTGDDELDITVQTPSDRSTDNIITLINNYNIDDVAAEHIFDGSIVQATGNTIYDGFVVIGASSNIQILQNGAVIADDWWNSNGGLNPDTANGISHRFMLKVRDAGLDIDGRRIVSTTRNFGFTFGEFRINGSARGNNVIALTQSTDLNNQTPSGTVAAWTSILNENEGYVGVDADGNGSPEFYYSSWELGSQSVSDFYERMKYLSREGSAETLYGLSGELFRGVTHEIDVDNHTGTFVEPEAISWVGGTGQLLAIDSVASAAKVWMQLLTGVAPTNGQTITGLTSGATVSVNGTATERPVSSPFIGQSTGSAIIGAYGVGVGSDDLTASDLVTALDNVARTPPNNVTFSVNGLVVGEDRILVGPELDGSINVSQFTLAAALNADNVATAQISSAIPTDTPSSGTIRIADDRGLYRRVEYSSYAGDTFTISSVDGSEDFAAVNASLGNNVFISYLDKLAATVTETFTSVFLTNRPLFIRVRDGGDSPIKTFETTGTLTSAGGSSTIIRTSDE